LSRNRDRLGAQQPDTSAPPQVTQSESNGGFSFVVPTEFVELPSRGKFYPQGHPLRDQETIEIKHMTAKEEDLLTSQSLLKKGIVLDRLIESVIINKRIRPESILIGDRNAILVAARISGYGYEYKTKITCPACSSVQDYNFDLSTVKPYHGDGYLEQEATLNENGTFTTILPKTKIEVTFKLLSGYDEKNLVKQIENAKKAKKDENNVTRQLKQFVVAVNGDTDQRNINYVVENMPSMDVRFLKHVYKVTNPNLDMINNFECDSCGHEQELEVPVTANFFWPE
tara:strand:- start:428 stop:1279 length:852 start_codon:yes stop_codon:yes gene_type:complete